MIEVDAFFFSPFWEGHYESKLGTQSIWLIVFTLIAVIMNLFFVCVGAIEDIPLCCHYDETWQHGESDILVNMVTSLVIASENIVVGSRGRVGDNVRSWDIDEVTVD